VLKVLLGVILEFVYGKLMDGLAAYIAHRRRVAEIEERSRKVRLEAEAAQTKEQRDAATDSARDAF
jgi:VIT1/CCC1 family predicted Fe2+/Mn2+ transporter